MIFDSHAHYDDEAFDEDREELLGGMQKAGIAGIVNVGASLRGVRASQELAGRYPFIYAAVGVHPDEAGSLDEDTLQWMYGLCKAPKTVAVGEIGLDYYWDNESHDVQKEWFIRQLELARRLNMPVNIHSREAAADTMEIMKTHGSGMKAIIHCYSYSREMALEYVRMGYLIGVGGVVTFKNAKKLKETVKAVPLSNIVLETDCPYLAPEPNRGKRNSSLNLPYVAQAVAELKGVTAEEVVKRTAENAKTFYKI